MSEVLKCGAGLYREALVIDPQEGHVAVWIEEVIRRAVEEPEREFVLLFNGQSIPVRAWDTIDDVYYLYHDMLCEAGEEIAK